MEINDFVSELGKLRPNSTFVMVERYTNNEGEVSDFQVLFHISYENALRKSLKIVEEFKTSSPIQEQARSELISSFTNSLNNIEMTSVHQIDDAYHRFFDDDGNYIKGVKLHRKTGELHLYGFVVNKRVHIPVQYRQVNSRPLTIEKKKIQAHCPVSKFRQYIISPHRVLALRVEHMRMLPPESPDYRFFWESFQLR